MKTLNRCFTAGFVFSFLSMLPFAALPAAAQITTLLTEQQFSGSGIPSGWSSSNSSWSRISVGDGGNNGSAMGDVYDYYFYAADPLTAPAVDASNYTHSTDSVWVDFDFYWEYNGFVSLGPDTWKVMAGTDVLQLGTEVTLNTYYNPNNFDDVPSQTSSSYWKHYHLLVPASDRGAAMVVTFEVVPGWGASNPAIDNVVITATRSNPVTITQQPSGATVCAGSSATFSVTATGDGLTYQWLKTGTPIAGATSSTYTISVTHASDSGSYAVAVQGSADTLTSNSVDLIVNALPSITSQPASVAVCMGQSASFSVSATGTNLSYQWQKNNTNIIGATGASYSISSVHATDSGTYDVVVSGTCSPSVTSNTATLTIYPLPTIAVSLSPNSLWPANHKMRTISATITTTGHCTPLSVQLLSITSSEPGTGETDSIASDGSSFQLLADRNGNSSDRVYTATYEVTDNAGNSATTSATVTVPHNAGGKIAVGDAGGGTNVGVNAPLELTVRPNPAANYAEICVPDLPAGIPTSLDVVNEAGVVVAMLYSGTPEAELGLSLRFDCSNLPNGTYFAHLLSSGVDQAAKISVSH